MKNDWNITPIAIELKVIKLFSMNPQLVIANTAENPTILNHPSAKKRAGL